MTTLPVELIERVIDHIADDHSILKQCTLTHPDFLTRCRVHLFREVVLCRYRSYSQFLELIDVRPQISGLVQSVVFMDLQFSNPGIPPCPILQVLDRLPTVRSLHVRFSNSPMSWSSLPEAHREAVELAVSRPSITCISLDFILTGVHDDVQRLLRQCAGNNRLRHLKTYFLCGQLTRESLGDNLVSLQSLTISGPVVEPDALVPRILPLLDLSQLSVFRLDGYRHLVSSGWFQQVSKSASNTLHTLHWTPSAQDYQDGAEIYPLSHFFALQNLHLDFSDAKMRFTALLRRIMGTKPPSQHLKSLTLQCEYDVLLENHPETFTSYMKDFLGSLVNVDHTTLCCLVLILEHVPDYGVRKYKLEDAGMEPKIQRQVEEALVRLQGEDGLEGRYPGTSCSLIMEGL